MAIALAAIGLAGAARSDAAGMRLGLLDPIYTSGDPATRQVWLQRGRDAGAGLVSVVASWSAIAPPSRSVGFNPRSPADQRYSFAALDTTVREVTAAGLDVVFVVGGAPAWAEAGGRPASAPPGTWMPDPQAFGDFTAALAARYSGSFADPLDPTRALPRVRYFRVWNEPNLPLYLTPQWSGSGPASPDRYRRLVNAAYAAIKGVSRANQVIAGGLAPYGDQPGEERMRPITFIHRLFCLNPRGKRARGCREHVSFDIFSHHPINQFAPQRSAGNPRDVTTPDLDRIRRVLLRARTVGTARPRGPKPLWVTEFWWASDPPSKFGVPPQRHARWLEQALYLFWKQRVRVAIWLQIRDPAPGPAGVGSGLYTRSGRPKPALRAFRFPFVTDRTPRARLVQAWGIAPKAGVVLIQRRVSGSWRTQKRVRPRRGGVFTARIRRVRGSKLRARLRSGDASLTWTQR